MKRPMAKLLFIVLLAVIGCLSFCWKAEVVSEADVLGTWEIKSWVSAENRFKGCDMLGTLVFSPVSYDKWRGVRVDFTFTREGVQETSMGYANLDNLPRINFYVFYPAASIVFDGFIDDRRMLGRLGRDWANSFYYNDGDWWEAVKK